MLVPRQLAHIFRQVITSTPEKPSHAGSSHLVNNHEEKNCRPGNADHNCQIQQSIFNNLHRQAHTAAASLACREPAAVRICDKSNSNIRNLFEFIPECPRGGWKTSPSGNWRCLDALILNHLLKVGDLAQSIYWAERRKIRHGDRR